jgi:AmiR/NasT family two-component response regulator
MTEVLIVGYERLIALDMVATLAICGHQVVGIAETAVEALKLANNAAPQVAIVNVTSEHGGCDIDAARMLKELLTAAIVLHTSCSDVETMSAAEAVQPAALLAKSASRHELALVVNALGISRSARARKLAWEHEAAARHGRRHSNDIQGSGHAQH